MKIVRSSRTFVDILAKSIAKVTKAKTMPTGQWLIANNVYFLSRLPSDVPLRGSQIMLMPI